jgi:hypothetical protein
MKFSDITGQDVTTLTEAPMGFMKSLTTGAKALLNPSLSGRKQAQGQFKTGMSANQIYGEFYKWLGSTQEEQNPTTSNVIAFLQQQGYGQQAIAAAQSKFPKSDPSQTTNQTSQSSTNQGQSLDLDQLKRDKEAKQAAGQANQQQALQQMQQTQQANAASAQADNELVSAVKAAKAKPGFQQTAQDKLTIQKGAAKGIHESKKRRLREDQELTKDQLSAIFTAVAQSGATPQATQSSGTAGSNTVEPNSDSGSDQAQSSNTSNQQARASGLPARLTAEQILNYYANLTSPYERDQVKKGIAEIDKQLTGQAQQAKQQPAK